MSERKEIMESPSHSKTRIDNVANQRHNNFSMMKNFKSWLSDQKKIWKEKKSDQTENIRTGDNKSILQITA